MQIKSLFGDFFVLLINIGNTLYCIDFLGF